MLDPERNLTLRIADADIVIGGPKSVIDVVDRVLEHVSRVHVGSSEPLRIAVCFESDMWTVRGTAPGGRKSLGRRSALPQVAGAVVSSLLAELAYHRNFKVWRAAVVERNGRALAFIGDDWESCITLVAHLHMRGWQILGGDYALVAGDTFVVSAFKKALHANSSCIASFPTWYRRAIEASPWYSASQIIAFYAIDPTLASATPPWGENALLAAAVRLDGRLAEHPSLETVDDFNFISGVSRRELVAAGVEVANLVLGDFVETSDLLEQWFASLPAAAQRTAAGV